MWADQPKGTPFQTLAVVSFAHFDPEGGEPGGGLDDDVVGPAAAAPETENQPEPAEPEARPEPELEIEPEPELEPEPEIIESVSERADPLPVPPPPPPLTEAKPKPKTKPAPKPAAPKKTEAGADGAKLPGGGAGQGQGGIGGGTGQGNPGALDAYLAQVRRRLVNSRKYPPAARSQKLEGVATVSFILTPDGRVLSSRLVNSSGHTILDDEVMALVRRVSPFPARPKGLPQDNLSLTVPIQFSLR